MSCIDKRNPIHCNSHHDTWAHFKYSDTSSILKSFEIPAPPQLKARRNVDLALFQIDSMHNMIAPYCLTRLPLASVHLQIGAESASYPVKGFLEPHFVTLSSARTDRPTLVLQGT